jgi:hypothetical protein
LDTATDVILPTLDQSLVVDILIFILLVLFILLVDINFQYGFNISCKIGI